MAETRCRHSRMWIIAAGYWFWCYECGALRQAEQSKSVNGSYPIGPWIRPVGKSGENPYEKLADKVGATP